MPTPAEAPALPSPPLSLFAILEAPYGMQSALVSFIPMILLRNSGVSIERAGAISALCLLPATFYFAYAPLVDFFVRRRTWLMLAISSTAVLAGIAVASSGSSPIPWITALLFSSTVSSMFISAATGGLMGSLLRPEGKSRVGAWVQLGNCGANALFFGFMTLLQSHVTRPLLGLITALMMLLPLGAGLLLREPPLVPSEETYGATMLGIFREVRATFFSLRRLPGILLLLSPIGTGAITTVLPGLARDYHANPAQLAFANGWGGGLLTAVGCLGVLLFPARWNRLIPYAVGGIIYGSVSLLIAAGPLQPATLVAGLLASNFVQGIAYAAYTGVVLQTMGVAGRCHSSRYTILNSIGNMPVVYMTAFLSWAAGHFGARYVGLADGLLNLATVALFFAWFVWIRRRSIHFLEDPAPLGPQPAV